MGKTMYDICGINDEDFLRIYAECGTVRATARHLGVSTRTVSKYRMEAGLKVIAHRPKTAPGTLTFAHDTGVVAKWLREHPGQRLPYAYDEAAALTGLPVETLRRFVERRNKKIKRWALSLGPLNRLLSTTLVSTEGRKVPARYLKEYALSVDSRMGTIRIRGKLTATCELEFLVTVAAYASFFAQDFYAKSAASAEALGAELPESSGA